MHENHDIEPPLTPGDVVYYWFYVVHNGVGHQMTDLSWAVVSGRYYIHQHLSFSKMHNKIEYVIYVILECSI